MMKYLTWGCVLLFVAMVLVGVAQYIHDNGPRHSSDGFPLVFIVILCAVVSVMLVFAAGERNAQPKVTSKDVVKILTHWGVPGSRKAVVEFLDGRITITSCPDTVGDGDHLQLGSDGKPVRFPVERSA
jgi:hypothetical protein